MRRGWVVLALVLPLTGCEDSPRRYDDYTAIGDSFTSGAGLPSPVASSGPCQQSQLSYPRRVAEELGADLRDVSCGGARTTNALEPQPRSGTQPWPPQLDGVQRGTDLVTVSLAFNDFALYGALVSECTAPAQDPAVPACAPLESSLAQAPEQIGERLQMVVAEVRDRAPQARMLVVGYPQLVPASGSCKELPMAAGDLAAARERFEELDAALQEAAEAAGADFVDVYGASEGHDVCAGDDAWVSGGLATPEQVAPYHPFASGQQAVAELVLEALGD